MELGKDTKAANPLVEMKVAPANSGDLNNGIFKLNNPNRYSGTHQGLDLAAEVGTPIYAPCDGTISNYCYITGQPDKTSKEYPNGYTGDTDSAGNRFGLECTLSSGEKITYMFWHLQAGTPMAVNPRTGKTFKRGDTVYQGDKRPIRKHRLRRQGIVEQRIPLLPERNIKIKHN